MKSVTRILAVAVILAISSTQSAAQEIRYSWFEIGYMAQEAENSASLTDSVLGQTVAITTTDGNGIRFRGSVGTWHNLYAFFDYGATDIVDAALVSNAQGDFPATDEFDLTTVRGGAGLRIPMGNRVDLFGELSYDSTDFDFGSFAGENFDARDRAPGGAIGARIAASDRVTLKAYGRYTSLGEVDLNTGEFSSATVYGAGIGILLIRGLSITGEYESGELSYWSIGFRLDLDED
jgi:hypothetical protein